MIIKLDYNYIKIYVGRYYKKIKVKARASIQ